MVLVLGGKAAARVNNAMSISFLLHFPSAAAAQGWGAACFYIWPLSPSSSFSPNLCNLSAPRQQYAEEAVNECRWPCQNQQVNHPLYTLKLQHVMILGLNKPKADGTCCLLILFLCSKNKFGLQYWHICGLLSQSKVILGTSCLINCATIALAFKDPTRW